MLAALRERYGGLEQVELRDLPRPTPVGDEVLVRMVAASVNRADLDLLGPRPAFVRLAFGVRAPRDHGLGCDLAGTVEAVGPDVTRFKPGDTAFGDMFSFGLGAFAEFKCAPERALLTVPSGIDLETAATLPHAGVLAVQSLRRRDGRTVEPGDLVLVDGASGSVGPFAIQIAKALGAEVTGVCSAEKVEFVRALGADRVIDYASIDVTTGRARYDWILDVDSHHPILRWRRVLKAGGTYVTLGGSTPRLLAAMTVGPVISMATKRSMGLMLWWKPFRAEDVSTLTDLIASGKLTSAIDRRYPLSEVLDALRYVADGSPRGKVVVVP
jgi:NADPH:quinone reductase-like Zn-dependent oxidoreductase